VVVLCSNFEGNISFMAKKEVGMMAIMTVDKSDDSNTLKKPQQRVLDEDTYLEVGA